MDIAKTAAADLVTVQYRSKILGTPILKIANFKSKYLENCQDYEKLSARKVSQNFL